MKDFPAYWTTAEFTGQLASFGWLQEPRARTWDPTTRWQQLLTYSGPATTVNQAVSSIVATYQFKPFQMHMQPDGPNIRARIIYFSDDYDGMFPRDPLLTTWGLHVNIGSESVLWCKKTMWGLRNHPDLVRRVQVASLLYENALGPMTNTFWQNFQSPATNITALQNALFTRVVCEDAAGALIKDSGGGAGTFTPTTQELWYANQLYRLLCKGVTTVPQYQYVLRKTSVVFPKNKIGEITIGSDLRTNYQRIGYVHSFKALLIREPDLNDEAQYLLNTPQLPQFWWVKLPPHCDQTNDARWTVTQEYWGVEWFEPYLWPWETAPGETFNVANGEFDPNVFYDSVRTGDPYPPEITSAHQHGMKSSGNYQWPIAMQRAIFGGQIDLKDL